METANVLKPGFTVKVKFYNLLPEKLLWIALEPEGFQAVPPSGKYIPQ